MKRKLEGVSLPPVQDDVSALGEYQRGVAKHGAQLDCHFGLCVCVCVCVCVYVARNRLWLCYNITVRELEIITSGPLSIIVIHLTKK